MKRSKGITNSVRESLTIGGDYCPRCGDKNRLSHRTDTLPMSPLACAACITALEEEGRTPRRESTFPASLRTIGLEMRGVANAIDHASRDVRDGIAYFSPATLARLRYSRRALERIIDHAVDSLAAFDRAGITGGSTDEGAGEDDARRTDAPPPVVLGQGAYQHGYTPSIGGGA